jgi:hypothetical protein
MGIINYLDTCYDMAYQASVAAMNPMVPPQEVHVTFGSNTLYRAPSPDYPDNRPILYRNIGPVTSLLDFGNLTNGFDYFQAGAPGFTNIVWALSK